MQDAAANGNGGVLGNFLKDDDRGWAEDVKDFKPDEKKIKIEVTPEVALPFRGIT